MLGLYRGNGKKKMETTIAYWGYRGVMETENGNYYRMLGLYKDNGKDHGNLVLVLGSGYTLAIRFTSSRFAGGFCQRHWLEALRSPAWPAGPPTHIYDVVSSECRQHLHPKDICQANRPL